PAGFSKNPAHLGWLPHNSGIVLRTRPGREQCRFAEKMCTKYFPVARPLLETARSTAHRIAVLVRRLFPAALSKDRSEELELSTMLAAICGAGRCAQSEGVGRHFATLRDHQSLRRQKHEYLAVEQ